MDGDTAQWWNELTYRGLRKPARYIWQAYWQWLKSKDKLQISREFGYVLKSLSRILKKKSLASWEGLGDRRPRPKFLAIGCRKEEVDRGGILIGIFKKCIVIPFKTREQFSGVSRGTAGKQRPRQRSGYKSEWWRWEMGASEINTMEANTMCRPSVLFSTLFEMGSDRCWWLPPWLRVSFPPCTLAGAHGILEVEWECRSQLGAMGQRASGTWGSHSGAGVSRLISLNPC